MGGRATTRCRRSSRRCSTSQLQLLGDTEGVDEVVLRGSIQERNLVGFYLREERLIAAVVVGQAGDMVEELKTLVREKPRVSDRDNLANKNFRPAAVFGG